MDFKSKLINFLYGRYMMYGIDTLTKVIFIVYIIVSFANAFIMKVFWPAGIIVYVLALALIVWAAFRLLSKNITKRQSENAPFAKIEGKIKSKIELHRKMQREKETHVYKKCPHCSVILRLPRKPGKHTVNCPRCKNDFTVKVK